MLLASNYHSVLLIVVHHVMSHLPPNVSPVATTLPCLDRNNQLYFVFFGGHRQDDGAISLFAVHLAAILMFVITATPWILL